MGDDNLDREFYDTMYPRRRPKPKQPRDKEKPAHRPTGFFPPRRRAYKLDMDTLERQFIEDMEAIGRGDIADDDTESFAVAFNRWLKKNGLE